MPLNTPVLQERNSCPSPYTVSPTSGQKLSSKHDWTLPQPLFFSKFDIGRVVANRYREKTPWMFHAVKK